VARDPRRCIESLIHKMTEKNSSKKIEIYKKSKLTIVLLAFSIFFWLIAGLDQKIYYTPTADELIIYNGRILRFIENPSKYGSEYLIDFQVENEIKQLWFTSPVTRFWHVLKDNYPNAYLTVYGHPYNLKKVTVWGLQVDNKILFTYDDRIQMAKEQTSQFKSISIKMIFVCLVLLVIVFTYERKRLQEKHNIGK
jgi:hypothetical protein